MTADIIDFPKFAGTVSKNEIQLLDPSMQSVVRDIMDGGFRIHEERLKKSEIVAMDFFRVLAWAKKVDLLKAGEVDLDSIIRVKNSAHDIYDLCLRDFIRLTERKEGGVAIDQSMSYLEWVLRSENIHMVDLREIGNLHTESMMDMDALKHFHPKSMQAFWKEDPMECFYGCVVRDLNGEAIKFTVDNFKKPWEISLLQFLCNARADYVDAFSKNGRVQMELTLYAWLCTHTTFIPLPLLDIILLEGICGKSGADTVHSADKRIKDFHDQEVEILLTDHYRYGGKYME